MSPVYGKLVVQNPHPPAVMPPQDPSGCGSALVLPSFSYQYTLKGTDKLFRLSLDVLVCICPIFFVVDVKLGISGNAIIEIIILSHSGLPVGAHDVPVQSLVMRF